LFDKGL